jgi:putative endonuclease
MVVYCLVSIDGKHRYVGLTTDAAMRLKNHNDGKVRSTAKGRPYRMIILRHVANRIDARRSEKYFKTGFGRKQLDRMLQEEQDRGSVILDAEAEGFLINPFLKGD